MQLIFIGCRGFVLSLWDLPMGVDGASAGGDPSRETICGELAAKHGVVAPSWRVVTYVPRSYKL